MISIAIFASGTGSNAFKIMDRFRNHPRIRVTLLACNKPQAGVIKVAQKEGIEVIILEKNTFFYGDSYVTTLQAANIRFIVLAGFLWKIPDPFISAFSGKIINIHPSLLPNYGGKGMYGMHVHEAVIFNKEKESGITIHYVDGQYDHGEIIFQARCIVEPEDTPEQLASKIHHMEHRWFPEVIEDTLLKEISE